MKKKKKSLSTKKYNEVEEDLFSKLPIDIVFDILCRLPLKTISRLVISISGYSKCGNEVEVFNLGSDSWRLISTNIPYVDYMNWSHALLNGCLHWIASSTVNDKFATVILSLNVSTEEFSIIQMPSNINGLEFSCYYELTVLREHLCVTFPDSMGYNGETWVMNEYGKLGSWAKENVFIQELSLRRGHEVMELSNNELFMIGKSHGLGYYNPEKKTFDNILVLGVNGWEVGNAEFQIFLTGSLLSPRIIGNH
ncbi:hypothetical protein IFM89_004147 [Coptis chinensis]|uniref:F-box associated beta-propeller type 1 domain-containing protein n=1 Tax=Coptis chinensis TaxID=261450 RepID=A0A835H1T8_9MAGN|nr:hypothetical protein IFM89_004147 [Coptis chinensis]